MSLADIMSAAGLTSWAEVGLILCFLVFSGIIGAWATGTMLRLLVC